MTRITCITLIKNTFPLMALVLAAGAAADTFDFGHGEIHITPMVHASVQVEYQGQVIQVDPWSPLGKEAYKDADLILVTDSPTHHKDPATINGISDAATTVIAPQNSQNELPQAIIMNTGDLLRVNGINVEAVAAYDIIPGAPEHPKGDANGYLLDLNGTRLFFAGVTECVEEVKALEDIHIAFMPMNIPVGRMTPDAAAECTKLLNPHVVYVYHFDQDWVRRLNNPDYAGSELPGGISVRESLDLFASALEGTGIEFRRGSWYPDSE